MRNCIKYVAASLMCFLTLAMVIEGKKSGFNVLARA